MPSRNFWTSWIFLILLEMLLHWKKLNLLFGKVPRSLGPKIWAPKKTHGKCHHGAKYEGTGSCSWPHHPPAAAIPGKPSDFAGENSIRASVFCGFDDGCLMDCVWFYHGLYRKSPAILRSTTETLVDVYSVSLPSCHSYPIDSYYSDVVRLPSTSRSSAHQAPLWGLGNWKPPNSPVTDGHEASFGAQTVAAPRASKICQHVQVSSF